MARLTDAIGGRRRGWVAPLTVGAVLWIAIIGRSAMRINGHWYFSLFDDAMVSMRYARNLAHGHGLVWNSGGAHVEGYTNFLWTVWMAVLHILPLGDSMVSLAVMVTGFAVLAGIVVTTHGLASDVAPDAPLAATLAAWAVVFYYPLAYWVLRGMEVGVVALALLIGVRLALRLRDRPSTPQAFWLGVALAVAALTRDDAAVPAMVILIYLGVSTRRRDLATVVLPAACLAVAVIAHAGFRLWFYGDVLPNTYRLKLGQQSLAGRVRRGAVSLGAVTLDELIVPVLLAVTYLGRRRGRSLSTGLLLAGVFASVCAYSVFVGGDAWEQFEYANRYISVAVPMVLVLAAVSVVDLAGAADRLRVVVRILAALAGAAALLLALDVLPLRVIQDTAPDAGQRHLRILLLLVVAACLLALYRRRPASGQSATRLGAGTVAAVMIAAVAGVSWATWIRYNAKYVSDFDVAKVRYALAQRDVTTPDAVIAVAVAGAMPYFSGRPAVDLLGKSDRVVARERPRLRDFYPGHTKWDYRYSVCTLRPDLVAELWDATDADRALIEGCGYTRVRRDDIYVRNDSRNVNRAALNSVVARLEVTSPLDF